ncbi:hypothetical protein C5O18_05175 [Amnimonas aquatica]|uniref:DUF2061 domain-containing protein n=1 Tax=Amnimonas aquatica TaxID=2094561 RepID=A0A2P6ASV9_9GAMM|nr:hypothetical protein C5O18_05175 [Amnimonas aquatica]
MRKTTSFAIVHFGVAFTVSYLLTGSVVIAGALALIEPMVNTVAFFIHDWTWDRFGSPAENVVTETRTA